MRSNVFPPLLLLLQENPGQVVPRLVARREGAYAIHQLPERLRIDGDGFPLRPFRHLREVLAPQSRQTEMSAPRRDLHVVPFFSHQGDGTFGKDLRDVE